MKQTRNTNLDAFLVFLPGVLLLLLLLLLLLALLLDGTRPRRLMPLPGLKSGSYTRMH